MDDLLHLPTIMVIYALGTLMVGSISLTLWLRDRSNRPFLLLTVAASIGIVGAVLHGLRSAAPFWLTTGVGFPLVFLGTGLFWTAFVAFEGRRPNYWLAATGAMISIALTPSELFQDSTTFRAILAAIIVGTYNLLSAWEVYRHSESEPLPSRNLAAFINAAHAGMWYIRIPMALLIEAPSRGEEYAQWFVIVTLFTALHNIFAMFALTLLGKDRSERQYRIASEIDNLTGVNNRRMFVERAREILEKKDSHAALLMFDIDKFKLVNDTYGHACGDTALIAFANCLQKHCKDDWAVGRLGGEEFACLIPGADLHAGLAAGEMFRSATEGLVVQLKDTQLHLTVSIGVASNDDGPATLDSMLALADLNLYKAKSDGRNRVCGEALAGLLRTVAPDSADLEKARNRRLN